MMKRAILVAVVAVIWPSADAVLAQQANDLPQPVRDGAVVPSAYCGDECCCESDCATRCNCQRCQEVCSPMVYPTTEERSCWEVKCKKVCVPAVRFPWESGCCAHCRLLDCLCRLCCGSCSYAAYGSPRMAANCCDGCSPPYLLPDTCDACGGRCHARCGRVRHVNTLEEKTYEVSKCECQWNIRRLPSCSDCGCSEAIYPSYNDSGIRMETEIDAMPVYTEFDE